MLNGVWFQVDISLTPETNSKMLNISSSSMSSTSKAIYNSDERQLMKIWSRKTNLSLQRCRSLYIYIYIYIERERESSYSDKVCHMIICRINVNVGISSPWHTGSLCHPFLDPKGMLLYVTKLIRNIHWNDNDNYNLVMYLFIFNNCDAINDQKKSNINVCLADCN